MPAARSCNGYNLYMGCMVALEQLNGDSLLQQLVGVVGFLYLNVDINLRCLGLGFGSGPCRLVCAHVGIEAARLGKHFVAQLARILALLGVQELVEA